MKGIYQGNNQVFTLKDHVNSGGNYLGKGKWNNLKLGGEYHAFGHRNIAFEIPEERYQTYRTQKRSGLKIAILESWF